MKSKEGKGNDMNAIARRITATPAANAAEMAMRIKREAPTLADLNNEQLEQIAKIAMTQNLTAEFSRAVDLAGIDWQKERETFLTRKKSEHTRRAYAAALGEFEQWAEIKKKNPLELNAADADQFIYDMKAKERAKATTRRNVAAISAFYSFLERSTSGKIKNPVRGTGERPEKENKKDAVIPTEKDYKTIIDELPLVEKAIVITMATRGLRAGALPTLELRGEKYIGKSKGKRLEENGTAGITLPQEALKAIRAAGLDEKKPFAWKTSRGTAMNAGAIESRINKHIGKLNKAGKIAAPYSCHDFRHYFAIRAYEKNHDIYRLSKLLNHAGIQITQTYLHSIGIEL